MALKIGKYEVCILDLLTDSRTKRLSASKLWLHIGNIILSYVMLNHESADWELMATYGAVVAGSYVGIIFFKLRWGNSGGAVSGGDNSDMLDAAQPEHGMGEENARPRNRKNCRKPKGRVRR